jgi:hypothetical protein
MHLLRIVGITLAPLRPRLERFAVQIGRVHVETLLVTHDDRQTYMVLVAHVPLKHRPKRTRSKEVVVPERERREARIAIESVANVLVVAEPGRRKLSSPNPYVAFRPESDEEYAWLQSSAGILGGLDGQARGGVGVSLPLNDELLGQVEDRWDGVALLAEAHAHSHPTGQFHELVRLFERAFQRPVSKLPDLLPEFLHPPFGYERSEIVHWVEVLRHPATHADVRRDFVLEADVRPVILRMEQAAVDVLLNKARWRDPSTVRRDAWLPTAGTRAPDGEAYAFQHTEVRIIGELSDRWGEYPLDLERRIRAPESWWPPPPVKITAPGPPLEVIPDPRPKTDERPSEEPA